MLCSLKGTVFSFFLPLDATAPSGPRASSFTRFFLDHTQRHTTVGRNPLNEWSARRRDLYLTTHNTHNRQTSMPPVGFETTVSAGERAQTYAPPLVTYIFATLRSLCMAHKPWLPNGYSFPFSRRSIIFMDWKLQNFHDHYLLQLSVYTLPSTCFEILFCFFVSYLRILRKWTKRCTCSFYVFISTCNSLHVSSTSCSSSGETNCINTASGNSHSMLVTEMCAGWKNLHTSRSPT